jgi:hypothetical protein
MYYFVLQRPPRHCVVGDLMDTLPQRLEKYSKQCRYRSGKPLRHPKAKTTPSFPQPVKSRLFPNKFKMIRYFTALVVAGCAARSSANRPAREAGHSTETCREQFRGRA